MNFFQVLFLAIIQAVAELLPVSSSAHVIVAEKLMGLDPASPEMTFLLVMLHTGTMFAVLFYFFPRWRKLDFQFFKMAVLATAITGVLGLGLKILIEKVILEKIFHHPKAEVEELFKSLPLIAFSLFSAGTLIFLAGSWEKKATQRIISKREAIWVGIVQALCLPFRGFSRSGATISASLFLGISKPLAENFSFILAVFITPPVILLQIRRLVKSAAIQNLEIFSLFKPGLIGMGMSFCAGLFALKFLSKVLEQGKWKYFGVYCWLAAAFILLSSFYL